MCLDALYVGSIKMANQHSQFFFLGGGGGVNFVESAIQENMHIPTHGSVLF